MKYLKIESAGRCDRNLLELLGVSTSREDTDKVGMFGSGAKFAPIALKRLGITVIIVSKDNKGAYKLEYGVRKDKHQRIFFKYTDARGKKKSVNSSYTTGMGMNWTEGIDENPTWKGVREFIANAQDADDSFHPDTHMSIVEKIKAPDAQTDNTCVYISMNKNVQELYSNLHEYYAYDKESWGRGCLCDVKPNYSSKTRFYVKDFLVEVIDCKSLFHYNLSDCSLVNEERTMKNSWARDNYVGSTLLCLEDAEMVKHLLKDFSAEVWENYIVEHNCQYYIPSMTDSMKELYLDTFKETFGEKALVKSAFQSVTADAIHLGYQVVDLPTQFSTFLPSADSITTVKGGYCIVDVDDLYPFERRAFDQSLDILTKEIPVLKSMNVNVFQALSPDQENINGSVTDGEIYINQKVLSKGIGSTLETLFHEINHIKSSAFDYSRELQASSDEMVARLLLRIYDTG